MKTNTIAYLVAVVGGFGMLYICARAEQGELSSAEGKIMFFLGLTTFVAAVTWALTKAARGDKEEE